MKQWFPRAILWDMDGTIVNSAEYHWLSWRDVLQNEGYPITYAQFAQTFGQRNDTILRGYFGSAITPGDIARIAEEKETCYRHYVRTRGIHLLPGVQHWLHRLHSNGWQQALASAAPRQNVETILEVLAIGSYFHAIVSAEDVQHGKPDPQVFLKAAEAVQVPPAQCVVIEDAPAGLEAARRAGMYAVGVRTTHHELEADRVVDTLEELAADTFDQLVGKQLEPRQDV